MEQNIKLEIIELHQFFQDWFNGKLENNKEEFSRVTSVLDDLFTLITPNGQIMTKNDLLDLLHSSHNSKSPELQFIIKIAHINVKFSSESLISTFIFSIRPGDEGARCTSSNATKVAV